MLRSWIARGLLAAGVLALLSSHAHASPQAPADDDTELRILQLDPGLSIEIAALRYVLTPEELDALTGLDDEEAMRRWIDDYWKRRDPIFTTTENEVRAEHERRVAYAAEVFRSFNWPGWDERGEVYIRYGPPAHRQIVAPEVTAAGTTPPREFWWYAGHEALVMFEDARSAGHFERVLFSGRSAGSARLYKVDVPIDAEMVFGDEGDRPADFMERVQPDDWIAFLGRFDTVVEETPSSYPTDFQRARLPFYFGVKRFRGGEATDRVDVNIEFVADLGRGAAGHFTKNYAATAVFWDTDGEEVGRKTQNVQLPTVQPGADSLRIFPAQLQFSMPPDFYHMGVTVREAESGRFSSFRQDVRCPDYDSKLAVSDIVFASRIADATRPSPFNRGPLFVVPHPYERYDRSGPIPIYFEVYNLTTSESGVASYTVEYEIIGKTPGKKPGFFARLFGAEASPVAVSASFRGTCRGGEDRIHIAVSPENLWHGELNLQVKITDDASGAEARSEAVFHMVEE